jgi:MMP endo-(1,4)-3-O-methyl-alpha-D-mannosidase
MRADSKPLLEGESYGPSFRRQPVSGTDASLLSSDEIAETASWLASQQLRDGMFPWYPGGHCDPWNHVEAAMALAAAGRWAEVERAFAWLQSHQLEDGSWCAAYVPGGVLEPHRDPNVCGYVATGAWWCAEAGGGPGFLETLWPMVERALRWCLAHQAVGGEIIWSVGPDGARAPYALLSGNSSLHLSFACAAATAKAIGRGSACWSETASRLAGAVIARPGAFAHKDRWAMDWYYPVLTGVLGGERARRRLLSRWEEMVVPGLGVRCVTDRFWVTAAETAECAMAAGRAGLRADAAGLLSWTRHLRHASGAYWTGCAHPECKRYPAGQLSTYSAAAVLLADHVLAVRSPAARTFSGAGQWDEVCGSAPSAWRTDAPAWRPETMQAGTPTPP